MAPKPLKGAPPRVPTPSQSNAVPQSQFRGLSGKSANVARRPSSAATPASPPRPVSAGPVRLARTEQQTKPALVPPELKAASMTITGSVSEDMLTQSSAAAGAAGAAVKQRGPRKLGKTAQAAAMLPAERQAAAPGMPFEAFSENSPEMVAARQAAAAAQKQHIAAENARLFAEMREYRQQQAELGAGPPPPPGSSAPPPMPPAAAMVGGDVAAAPTGAGATEQPKVAFDVPPPSTMPPPPPQDALERRSPVPQFQPVAYAAYAATQFQPPPLKPTYSSGGGAGSWHAIENQRLSGENKRLQGEVDRLKADADRAEESRVRAKEALAKAEEQIREARAAEKEATKNEKEALRNGAEAAAKVAMAEARAEQAEKGLGGGEARVLAAERRAASAAAQEEAQRQTESDQRFALLLEQQEGLNRRHSQRLASHGLETSPGKSGGTPQSTRADLSRRFGGFDVAPGGAPLEAESDLLRLRTALEPILGAPGAHAPSLASR